MRTRLLFLLAALVAFLPLSGCRQAATGGTAKRPRPLIGVSLLTQTHAFYKDLEQQMRVEAAARNMDLAVVSCEMDPARQASQLEDFITQHVDAMLVAPCDSAAVVPYIDKATQAAIPVFTVDIAARGGKVVSHVASDNEEGGRLAAKTLASLIGGKGEVVIIDHPEVASVQDRTRGFEQALKDFPGVTIVQRPSASGQRAKAMTAMEDMIQAHPHLRGVFGINDDSALGALSVVEAAKRNDIVIIGFDATAEAQAALRKGGALKADIAQHPDQIGKTAIDVIARHLAGEAVPAVVAVPVSVVDQKTLSQTTAAGVGAVR
jgi:ribose transport system substrate-binding protein